MANRRERRTKGKAIFQRLQVLKNSPLIQDADLSNLSQEVIDSLVAHTCENKTLQKRYDACQRILGEMILLEGELFKMKEDLKAKHSLQGKPQKRQSDEVPSPPL
jgi:uncharacterized protein (DUF1810 family)